MRISELARSADVPLATVKFYLRDGVLHPGQATGATQAVYDDSHLRRLRLVRALVDVGGLSIAAVRSVLACIDSPDVGMHDVLGAAHSALGPAAPSAVEPTRAWQEVRRLGWRVHPDTPALRQLERALAAVESVGLAPSRERLDAYADAALQVAALDVGAVPTTSREQAVEFVVAGTVLYEPVLLALRRLAQQHVSATRFG